MERTKTKIWELSLLIALCISLCQAAAQAGRADALSEKVVRMHVVAASDEPEAQEMKLRVRDAVLPIVSRLMADSDDASEAAEKIEQSRETLLAAAREAAGSDDVELVFGRESYGWRQTERYALPAGEYDSLRIILGSGEGHNWWGVIFPQLDATGGYAEAVKLLEEDELKLIYEEDGFELRFKLFEIVEKLMSALAK